MPLLLLAGCGSSERTFSSHGISFSYPSSWYATDKSLSNVTEPVYRFAVGNFRFHRTNRDLGPCLAGIAKQRGRSGVLVFMMESHGADRRFALPRVPARPRHIPLPSRSGNAWCLGRGSGESFFREAGRSFYLGISVGPAASPADKKRLRALLAAIKIE